PTVLRRSHSRRPLLTLPDEHCPGRLVRPIGASSQEIGGGHPGRWLGGRRLTAPALAITIGMPGQVGGSIGEWYFAESVVSSAAILASSSASCASPSCRSSSARLWWVSGSFGLAASAAR